MSPYVGLLIGTFMILQVSLISFPLVFLALLTIAIKSKKNWIFPLAFIFGVILDSFYLKTLGTTSIFFLIFLFAVFMYERKFEVDSLSFIFISSFLGSMILFVILGETNILLKSAITSLLAIFLSKIEAKLDIFKI